MKALVTGATLLAAVLVFGPASARARNAADPDALARFVAERYRAVDASVVRIRTVADMQIATTDPLSGSPMQVGRLVSVHGTGVVIGRVFAGGRWEYLILTNHHVADISNYLVQEGRFFRENKHNTRELPSVHEESYLIHGTGDEREPDDIRLLEVARNVKADMTLFRTAGADRTLTPFRGRIGAPQGQVKPTAPVITSGFPHARPKTTARGRIVEIHRRHDLGQPHHDDAVDLPLVPGLSGSPVFLVQVTQASGKTDVAFALIGLLHARDRHFQWMVPYASWKESLASVPGIDTARLEP